MIAIQPFSDSDEPVLDNSEDLYPSRPLDFRFRQTPSCVRRSKTRVFGDAKDIQNGGNS